MTISTAVRLYIAHKRAMGWSFSSQRLFFNGFLSHIGDVHLSAITPSQVACFMSGPRTSNESWHQKYETLERFFRHWIFRRKLETLPLPPLLPRAPRTFVPYIYSRKEIRRLVSVAVIKQTKLPRKIDPATFRAFLLFLYGTGVIVTEALRLREDDVDLKKNTVTLEGSRVARRRIIPIGPDVHRVLETYLHSPVRRQFQGGRLFLTRRGQPLHTRTLVNNFQELRRRARIVRLDGAYYQPRMHDLRSTFVVHRIAAWCQEERNLSKVLPALGAYLGQTGFGLVTRHLALTPEYFRKYVDAAVPRSRKA